MAEALAAKHPNDAPWATLLALLDGYKKMVQDHWPLTSHEKETVRLGWFSARNIEEVFPELDGLLTHLAYCLGHSGE